MSNVKSSDFWLLLCCLPCVCVCVCLGQILWCEKMRVDVCENSDLGILCWAVKWCRVPRLQPYYMWEELENKHPTQREEKMERWSIFRWRKRPDKQFCILAERKEKEEMYVRHASASTRWRGHQPALTFTHAHAPAHTLCSFFSFFSFILFIKHWCSSHCLSINWALRVKSFSLQQFWLKSYYIKQIFIKYSLV